KGRACPACRPAMKGYPAMTLPADYWASIDPASVPHIVTDRIPGPRSDELNRRGTAHMIGYSSQVRLCPVAFERGHGVTLTDVDGNTYLDFSSGIYVTTLGHCHPKISEAVADAARTLMNCHDFNTPVKVELLEKLAQVQPWDLTGIQLYDSGTTAVEAGLRVCRAATGRPEFISCFMDFHGKTGHAVSLGKMNPVNGPGRSQGFYLVPRPYPYRPMFTTAGGEIDTDAYLDFYAEFIEVATTGEIAAFVLEPVQGWAGSVIPPDDFFPKLRNFCDERGILLMADEVLTSMGRTGKHFCMEHWDTAPDVVTVGKGFGNGFPVTAMLVSERHKESIERISASTSYGGNPMACAAALASLEVIEEEGLLAHALELGGFFLRRMERIRDAHPIVGDVRGLGCLLGIELVRDRETREPFEEAGRLVYRRAFEKGLAWVPAGHILRMSPPIVMTEELAAKGLDIIEESIAEVEEELGY
ncbi:MAG: aspartate aminotransferase family protein, partial [Armatimonadetes bacterium]|nr:aspartate aminotransferase family protein [Armatimonadota bacterium]